MMANIITVIVVLGLVVLAVFLIDRQMKRNQQKKAVTDALTDNASSTTNTSAIPYTSLSEGMHGTLV